MKVSEGIKALNIIANIFHFSLEGSGGEQAMGWLLKVMN